MSGNRFTDTTLSDVEAQHQSLIGQATAAVSQLETLAGQDEKAEAFAQAAAAFMTWTQGPKEALGQVLDATKGTAAERLPQARSLLEQVQQEGAAQKQPAVDAQKACDDAGVSGNRFTDTTLSDVEAQHQSLIGQATAAVSQLETLAGQDEKAEAFAQAVAAFMTWTQGPKEALGQVLDATKGTAAERLPQARSLLEQVQQEGAAQKQPAVDAQKACDDAGVSGNRFTDKTLADVEAQHQSLIGQATAAVSQLETLAGQDEKAEAFAQAAAAFMTWTQGPKEALGQVLDATKGTATERLPQARSLLEQVQQEGAAQKQPAVDAQKACDDAGVSGNRFTDTTLSDVEAQHQSLIGQTTAAVSQLETLAGQDEKAEAFAQAAAAFMTWTQGPKEALGQVLDATKGTAAERLPQARSLLEQVQQEGAAQKQPAVDAQKACDDAGVSGNRFTDKTLSDVEAQHQSLIGQATAAVSQLETLAGQDEKAEAFAQAAAAFMTWTQGPKEALGQVLDATKGTAAERLPQARSLLEQVQQEGAAQKQPAVDAQKACDDAGVSGNRFTDKTLADVEAQHQSLIGQATAAVSQLETLAGQDEKAEAFAQAAAAFMTWTQGPKEALGQVLDATRGLPPSVCHRPGRCWSKCSRRELRRSSLLLTRRRRVTMLE